MISALLFLRDACAEYPDAAKLKLALFPFTDMDSMTFDMKVPAVLNAGLSGYEFIEVIPVEKALTYLGRLRRIPAGFRRLEGTSS